VAVLVATGRLWREPLCRDKPDGLGPFAREELAAISRTIHKTLEIIPDY
jgi:hypothetical protein